jgi:hypothetical protein
MGKIKSKGFKSYDILKIRKNNKVKGMQLACTVPINVFLL